jgi:hypothetical protein
VNKNVDGADFPVGLKEGMPFHHVGSHLDQSLFCLGCHLEGPGSFKPGKIQEPHERNPVTFAKVMLFQFPRIHETLPITNESDRVAAAQEQRSSIIYSINLLATPKTVTVPTSSSSCCSSSIPNHTRIPTASTNPKAII